MVFIWEHVKLTRIRFLKSINTFYRSSQTLVFYINAEKLINYVDEIEINTRYDHYYILILLGKRYFLMKKKEVI